MIAAHTEKKSRCVYPVVLSVPLSQNKMTLLLLQTCVFLASVSSAHEVKAWIEHCSSGVLNLHC